MTVTSLDEQARDFVTERFFCTSLQVAMDGPRNTGNYCYGEVFQGSVTRSDHLFNVHCATKPLVAMAVGLLVDQKMVELDLPVCEMVAGSGLGGSVRASLREVLDHTANLADPSMIAVNLSPLESRSDLVRQGIIARRPGYSEYAGQLILAAVISKVSGSSAIDFIESSVIAPLGLEGQIRLRFRSAELEEEIGRIGCYVRGLPLQATPTIYDWSPHIACIDRTCLGGYVSASGLMAFYSAVGRVYNDKAVGGLPTAATLHDLLGHPTPRRYDEVLERDCSFAGGFMVDLRDHGYGEALGEDSFGHTGLAGASFAFYDPASGVAGAVISNGLHSNHDDLDFLRSRMVSAIVEAAS